MTKLIVNTIDSRSTSTEFKDIITANHSKQWLDTYGVIKAFKNTIDENVIKNRARIASTEIQTLYTNHKIDKGEAITAIGSTAIIEAAYAEGVIGIAT